MDAKISDNYGVLTFTCVVIGVYLIIVIYARKKDKQDILKVAFFVLTEHVRKSEDISSSIDY